jgi:hypothetical protein
VSEREQRKRGRPNKSERVSGVERDGGEREEKKVCRNYIICQVCIEKTCLNKYYKMCLE